MQSPEKYAKFQKNHILLSLLSDRVVILGCLDKHFLPGRYFTTGTNRQRDL